MRVMSAVAFLVVLAGCTSPTEVARLRADVARLQAENTKAVADREASNGELRQCTAALVVQAAAPAPAAAQVPAFDVAAAQRAQQVQLAEQGVHVLEVSPPMTATPNAPTVAAPIPETATEEYWRRRISDVKAEQEAAEAAVKQECPELRPGDLRLDVAERTCVQLRANAKYAETKVTIAKREALSAGFMLN